MSKSASAFIPQVAGSQVSPWTFEEVDQRAARFAAKLKAQEEAESQERDQQAHQLGYAQGYAEGFAAGQAKGEAEATERTQAAADAMLAQFQAHTAQEAAQAIAQVVQGISSQHAAVEKLLADQVLQLVCALAKQVVRQELTLTPDAVLPVVKEALDMLTTDTKLAQVKLHPEDLALVADDLRAHYPALDMRFVADVSLDRGGCVVQAAGMVIDASVSRRWQKAVAAWGIGQQWDEEVAHDEHD
ncbi:hypothetical protein KIK84_04235 [Curvibacter sp. CHRR-16]|uniref:FliH/SctL family protein n=1 Tax=Curvibacter sp. CHRR-16 TaxID=2835872 RepID=UPI001BD95CD6|nr:FliH/SctL family protein [Curvibacter sp. CHRR-16]MBT0569522.1 hypothetical protein [Curvibacter sp. CHRR-16]